LRDVFTIYKTAGFRVTNIFCDPEYLPLMKPIQTEYGRTNFNYSSAEEHVPVAERNNRVIKERVSAAFHSLPFTLIPKVMLKRLVLDCTTKLNYFPPKGGISPYYYSPHKILHQTKLDYVKEGLSDSPIQLLRPSPHRAQPVQYARAPRTLDCIYLRPLPNAQGGHELFHLANNRLLTRRTVTVVPITQAVIDTVQELAAADKMKGLHLMTSHGKGVLYDSSWIAGVDYDFHFGQESETEDSSTASESSDSESETSESDNEEFDADLDLSFASEQDPIQEVESNTEEQSEATEQAEDDPPGSESDNKPDNEPEPEVDEPAKGAIVTRSGRVVNPPERYNLVMAKDPTMEYDLQEAKVLTMIISQINERANVSKEKVGTQFVVTYSLKKGIQKFGERGRGQAALQEMHQLHDRNCFRPIDAKTLSPTERARALESLIFLTEKRHGKIKAHHCAKNGSTQRDYISREEVASPTVSTESTTLTAVIEAEEGRDVATCDIPNAFIQTTVEERDSKSSHTIMKICGAQVDILCEMDSIYQKHARTEGKNNQWVLYVHITKALYGLMVSAMLFYKKLAADLIKYGFIINPYDPCVANKSIQDSQLTVSWHVDNLKVSHKNSAVVDSFLAWAKETYGEIGEVKTNRGKVHDYLGMKLDYTVPGQVSIDMVDYAEQMINTFPAEYLKGTGVTPPWTKNLFKVNDKSPQLIKEMAEIFHTPKDCLHAREQDQTLVRRLHSSPLA
jgi:Reverse transcriptase (RNA-dependent DNA polymerase)